MQSSKWVRTSCLFLFIALVAPATTAFAQQRPLATQDPETIGSGRILVEGGFDYGRDVLFPVSGLQGNLLRVPQLGVVFGISSIADIQVTGAPYERLAITHRINGPLANMVTATGDTTSDVDPIVFATKIKVAGETERRPAFALRFATKLPNDHNESGLGLDTTDFYISVLAAKTIESFRIVGNIGTGILGEATRGDDQNDVLTYGISLARAMTATTELVGEINGRKSTRRGTPPPGTESRSVLRFGGRYTRGPARFDASLLFGMTERDPSIGFGMGVTYIFNAFKLK